MSEDGEHSLRGPSGAHRWRRCPGSINAERGRPDNARREAAQGTVFHEYAAMCLMFGLEPEDFPLGTIHEQDGFEIEFDEDMVRYMHDGLDWVRDNVEPGDILLIEKKVDTSRWAGPGQFGTADVIIIKVAARKIKNFDWKYGKGVPVSPIKSDQMYLYNLGAWNDFAEKLFRGVDPAEIEVEFCIEQPRAMGGGGEWKTTMADCLAEGEKIKEDALATMAPNAPRVPGEKQCLFCKASGDCAEQTEYLLSVYGQKFDEIQENIELGIGPAFDDPGKMDLEARSFVLLHKKAFDRWVSRIHELTMHDLRAGREVPLLKAVEGKPGRRVYLPSREEDVKEAMIELVGEDQAFEKKTISPAAAEKLAGKKRVKEKLGALWTQAPGKIILVPLEDKRPPVQDFASKFDDLDDEDEEDGE